MAIESLNSTPVTNEQTRQKINEIIEWINKQQAGTREAAISTTREQQPTQDASQHGVKNPAANTQSGSVTSPTPQGKTTGSEIKSTTGPITPADLNEPAKNEKDPSGGQMERETRVAVTPQSPEQVKKAMESKPGEAIKATTPETGLDNPAAEGKKK